MMSYQQLKDDRDKMKASGMNTSALDAAIEACQETLDAALAEMEKRQAQERQARG